MTASTLVRIDSELSRTIWSSTPGVAFWDLGETRAHRVGDGDRVLARLLPDGQNDRLRTVHGGGGLDVLAAVVDAGNVGHARGVIVLLANDDLTDLARRGNAGPRPGARGAADPY